LKTIGVLGGGDVVDGFVFGWCYCHNGGKTATLKSGKKSGEVETSEEKIYAPVLQPQQPPQDPKG